MQPATTGGEAWIIQRPLWVIRIEPAPGEATLLQAELDGGHYLLCFTTEEKARAAIAELEMAAAASVPMSDDHGAVVTAVCQVGAVGIIADLEPATRRCAWSRQLVALA